MKGNSKNATKQNGKFNLSFSKIHIYVRRYNFILFNVDSFRTSMSGNKFNSRFDDKMEKTVAEVQERINDTQVKIDGEIEGLDEKLDKVLEKNEKDFLTAYRFHMLKV